MCTCIGITSIFSTTSRIERQARGVARTSRVLVSSTADTPTRSPSTCKVMLALPSLRSDRPNALPSPMLPEDAPPCPPKSMVVVLLSMPPPRICTASVPGISETGESPPDWRVPPPPAPNTSDRRSARSRALTYLSSCENSWLPSPAPSMRSSQSWMSSR